MDTKTNNNSANQLPAQPRSWRSLAAVLVFLLIVNGGFAIAVYFLEPTPIHGDIGRAMSFMAAIELGNGILEDQDTSGYEVAFDLLLPSVQEETEFAKFLYFFDDPVHSLGFIQTWRRLDRERGHFTDRRIRFEVEYGGMDPESTVIVYELGLSQEDGVYGIANYRVVSRVKKTR